MVDPEPLEAAADAPTVELELTVRGDGAATAVARQTLGSLARSLGCSPSTVADLCLAVSEVCAAAARGASAPVRVRAATVGDGLRVTVDAPRQALVEGDELTRHATQRNVLALPLVAALTSSLELRRVGGATEVVMGFPRP